MSAETVAYYAKRAPSALAIVVGEKEFTYFEVDGQIRKLMQAFLKGPAQPGQIVAVACPNLHYHLLILFALEALGIVPMPFVYPPDPGIAGAIRGCDLVLSPENVPGADKVVILTVEWIERVLAGPDAAAVPLPLRASDDLALVLTTSGSTGAAKTVLIERGQLELPDRDRVWQYGIGRDSRFLVAMPFSVGSLYSAARACLRARGAVLFAGSGDLMPLLASATHTLLLPVHVRQLLAGLPADYRAPHTLELISLGARLSTALRNRAAARLAANVHDGYGTNETGPISVTGELDTGDVLPGVEVEVVGDDDQALPYGVPGMIRVRAPAAARSYRDAEATARHFRGGWFYVGDVGVMPQARRLRVLGRADTMLNLGGIKISAEEIEDQLIQRGMAKDLAACTLQDSDDIEELYIAVEGSQGSDAQLVDYVATTLGPNFGKVRLLRVERIPRSPEGKVQRQQLRALIAQLAGKKH